MSKYFCWCDCHTFGAVGCNLCGQDCDKKRFTEPQPPQKIEVSQGIPGEDVRTGPITEPLNETPLDNFYKG